MELKLARNGILKRRVLSGSSLEMECLLTGNRVEILAPAASGRQSADSFEIVAKLEAQSRKKRKSYNR